MTVVKILLKKLPELIPENELNGEIVEFFLDDRYIGWLDRKRILESPLEMVGKGKYYIVEKDFLESPTFDHKKSCDHVAQIWDEEKRAFECLLCPILINDAWQRQVQDQGYECWAKL